MSSNSTSHTDRVAEIRIQNEQLPPQGEPPKIDYAAIRALTFPETTGQLRRITPLPEADAAK